jgi:Arc/MetJ-type ribon-helix-helix transcriptional regulator
MNDKEVSERDYEEIVVKLAVSNEYLRKLEQLIDVKRIFSSRAEAFRRALELLFEKYKETLGEGQPS